MNVLRKVKVDLLALSDTEAYSCWRLAHTLDAKIEECQAQGNSSVSVFEKLAPWLMDNLGAKSLIFRLIGAVEGEDGFFSFGAPDDHLHTCVESGETGVSDDGLLCCLPLRVNDEVIGYIGALFDEKPCRPGPEVLLSVTIEELDNVLYEFRRARLRHYQVVEIERRLQDPVLEKTIDSAAVFVIRETGITTLAVVFVDGDGAGAERTYRLYDRGGLFASSRKKRIEALDRLLMDSLTPELADFLKAADMDGGEKAGLFPVEAGLSQAGEHGFIVAAGPARSLSGAERELLHHFSIALGQRLVDYHREQRYLQQFFALPAVTRLLSTPGYFLEYMVPRLRHVAVLFSDIVSFTAISEQVLSGPEEVGEFVDYWSSGVVDILFRHGGTFDKMVGDCVIGLFGPPFDEWSPDECVARAIDAALEINEHTSRLTGIPAIEKISSSSVVPGLGVATGVNIGQCMVGAIGPNQDFTAFGREMNNTARLQGLAGFREVLVMKQAKECLEEAGRGSYRGIHWGPLVEKAVKNVKDPLCFYLLR